MLQEERLISIVSLVQKHRFCSVPQLSEWLNVSQATVRRDLTQLAKQAQIRLTRGGAMENHQSPVQEPAYDTKLNLNLEEKIRIGQAAVSLIGPGDMVLMDTGTTVLQMCSAMKALQNVTVATNDIRTASELARSAGILLHMLGGSVRKGHYTTTGIWTQSALEGLHVDKLFLSCDAVDLEGGCTITNAEEVTVKQAMIRASTHVILLADHSKFQSAAFMRLCAVQSIGTLITGAELDKQLAQRYSEAGVHLMLV